MQFVDFFAGIGGIRLGLEQAGHKCVGFCEFDKYARTAYKAMYDTEGEWENHDVRTVKPYDVPAADLWCFGFPCQDLSVAGKQKGLQEGERSGLFYEIMRLLAGRKKEDRPRWLLVENVKNLLSIGNGFDFARLLVEVGGYGYSCEWQVLNSKDFGVPQNRERVFIVGHLGNIRGREVFPLRRTDGENPCKLNEITQGVADAQRIYDGGGLARTLKGESGGQGAKTGLYAVKVLKPYGSTGGVCGLKIAENKTGVAAPCVARDYKGISRNNGNAVAILRKERNEYGKSIRKDYEAGKVAESRHNMTQYACRKDGISNTLTTVQKDNLLMSVYDEQNNTLRTDGTVGTLTTDGSSPKHNNRVIGGEGCNDGNAKERNTFEILCLLRKEIGEKAFAEWGIAIVAPFQQAEVLRQGVHEKSFSENREEQSDIQQRPYNSEIDKQVDYKRNCLPKMWDNAEFRCSPCGRGLYQQFREQFDCALQKLSYENPSPQEFMYSLWQASKGIRVLREALSEVQEIRGRIDAQWKKSVRIRRLTPREVWRLQGFPDEYFDKARAAGISDTQLYKQAGNSVSVPVAKAIGERLKEVEEHGERTRKIDQGC